MKRHATLAFALLFAAVTAPARQTYLESCERQLTDLEERLDDVLDRALRRSDDDGGIDLTEEEEATVTDLKGQIARSQSRVDLIREDVDRRAAQTAASAGRPSTTAQPTMESFGGAVVRAEPFMYDPVRPLLDGETSRPSFLRDLYVECAGAGVGYRVDGKIVRSADGWEDRLARHRGELDAYEIAHESPDGGAPAPFLSRATTSTSISDVPTQSSGALLPVAYRPDLVAPGLYGGRVTADICARYAIPTMGQVISLPRVTAKAGAGIQPAEGDDVTNSSPGTTEVELPVSTIAGGIEISRQAIERGMLVESIVMDELRMAMDQDCNEQVLRGTGANGQVQGILGYGARANTNYTWVEANPSSTKLWQVIIHVATRIAANRQMMPDIALFAPRRWGALIGGVDTVGRPLSGAMVDIARNVLAIGNIAPPDLRVAMSSGTIFNLDCMQDPNIPTKFTNAINTVSNAGTQDRIIIAHRGDLILLESATPMNLRFEASGAKKLLVDLISYGYIAFTSARYPDGVGVINGTGLTGELLSLSAAAAELAALAESHASARQDALDDKLERIVAALEILAAANTDKAA